MKHPEHNTIPGGSIRRLSFSLFDQFLQHFPVIHPGQTVDLFTDLIHLPVLCGSF